MSRRARRRLWWLAFVTVLVVPNCVRTLDHSEQPAGAPARPLVAGNGTETAPSMPPAYDGNGGVVEPVVDDPSPERWEPVNPTDETASTPDSAESAVERGNALPMLVEQPMFGAQGQFTEAIVRLRLEEAVDQVILGLTRDTTIFIPVGQFTDLAEVYVGEVEQGVFFRGRTGRRPVKFEINTERGVVIVGNEEFALDSSSAVWFNDDLFLDNKILARLFGIRSQMDWTDLELRVWDAGHLPAVARYDRALRRRFYEEIGTLEGAERLPTASPAIDGAVLDWSVTSLTTDPVGTSIMQFGAGGMVGGGSLDMRLSRVNSANVSTFDWSWVRAWSDNPSVRQLRAGEISSTGRGRNAITGASITNAPFRRPVAFADEILAGEFPEGWEVEVYRGSRLVAFTVVDSTGKFGIDLPVQYGPNPVTLVGYGPRGEVVTRERTFEIPFLRLPGGSFEYAASAGDCHSPHCQAGQNVDVRYGVNDRLTVQAGSDFFWRDTVPDLWAPYALASMAITRSLSLTGEGVLNGLARARADYAPTPNLRLSLTQTWFDQSDPSPLTGSVFEIERTQFAGFWRPGLLSDRVFFEARGLRSLGSGRSQELASLSSTLRWSGARVTAGLFVDRTSSFGIDTERAGIESAFNTIIRGPVPALRNLFLTAHARVDNAYGVSRYGIGAGRQIMQPLRVDVRAEWDQLQGTSINLELTSIFRQVRATSRNQYTRGRVYGSQQFEGSLLWNRPGRRAEFGNGRSMGRAGVTGVVFLDENLNGKQDPDEPGLGGVRVRVGSIYVTADSSGRFAAWDLVPFERAVIELDAMSIDNPLWVPKFGNAYITPTPNSYQLVELPVLQGGEVNGQVVFAENGRPLMGGSVLLIHQDTHDTTRVTTFSDGSFYSFGLRPGEYLADLAPGVLVRLNGVVAPVRFAIKPETGELFADDVTLVVVREEDGPQDGVGPGTS